MGSEKTSIRGVDQLKLFLMGILLISIQILSAISVETGFVSKINLLNQPESVVFDSLNGRYLVSNWADGKIISIDSLGEQTIFNEDLTSVAGIKIYNEKLYCCERTALGIIDLATGELDTLITVEGCLLLNDLEFLGDYIFISDYWDPKIYRMNRNDYSFEILVQQANFVPNGLCLDAENNRILAVVRNENGYQPRVMAIDPDSGDLSLVVNTPYYSLDGITRDQEGNWFLSSWHMSTGVQGIFKYPADFSGTPEVITTECDGPADIFIHDEKLVIPNLNINSIDIIDLSGGIGNTDQILQADEKMSIKLFPNPFNPETTIELNLPVKEQVKIAVFNVKGQKVKTLHLGILEKGEHKLVFKGKDDLGRTVSSGLYFIRVQTASKSYLLKSLLLK